MSSSGALKTVSVVSKVLYELIQQHKETFPELEELGQVILSTESVVSNFTPSPNQDEEQVTAAVSALVSGLERIHESIKKLDLHKGKVLFSEDVESNRILKQRDRIALITNALPKISEAPFDISELLQQVSAREFWSKHFRSKIHVVKWEVFRAEFEQDYGKKPELDIARLKRVLDHNNDDQVSIFDFADFSDSLGMPEAFELLIKKYLPDIPAALPENKNDPVQSNTVWRGVVTQTGCPEFDIVMQIKERSKDDSKIHGVMYWRESDSGQTKIRGEVDGDTIKFEEYQVTHGIGRIPFPNSYEGKVSGASISGIWTYDDQQGQFLLNIDTVPAVKVTPTSVEADDKDRRPTASSVASISGFLVKQGKLRKTWKTRYCVLQGGALRYYETKENYPLKPAGKIELTKGAVVQERPDIGQKTTLFEIITPSRTFYIQAESSSRRAEWVQALRAEISNWKS